MANLNIRIYKVIFANGTTAFETKTKDDRASIGCGSIKSLALEVKSTTKRFFLKHKNVLNCVTIDTKPYHEIEYPSGLQPRHCIRLSKKERVEFWKEFS